MNFKRTKRACYTAYFTMSTVFSISPILFMTFHRMYRISYTLLGTLVLANFCTQLLVDLVFTIFPEKFNVEKVVRAMPLITSLGLFVFALWPMFFPESAYTGLLVGTIIFSVAAGLSEALLSPTIAAIPSDTPQRDMTLLHSLYAFGLLTVVAVSTIFLRVFGAENWMYLTMFLAIWPLFAAALFAVSPMPDMNSSEVSQNKTRGNTKRIVGLALCVGCIFFGSCSENAMANWISGYMESTLGIDKTVGDILGLAMFAVLLGLTRILYARYGKNISRVLLLGMIGAAVCYLTIVVSSNVVVSVCACVMTGVFTSMLWPGTLIFMEENVPSVGVAAFALMAAGGDLGASLSPQLMGIVIDQVSASGFALRLSEAISLSPVQIGMKAGMLTCAIFPVSGMVLLLFARRFFQAQRGRL